MADLARLVPVFKLIEDRNAAKAGATIKKRQAIESQLEQIKAYREEYRSTQADLPVLLANTRAFLQRLDSAIVDSEQKLSEEDQAVARDIEAYNTAKHRRKIVEKLARKKSR